MATLLFTVWIMSGLAGARFGGLPPARGAEAVVDLLFAAVLGPFTWLLAELAAHAAHEPEGGVDGGSDHREPGARGGAGR